MTSPEAVFESSFSDAEIPRKSKFTYKHLHQLGLYSTATPLRVIAHIDLDAFYAQCESVRLGISQEKPLAVRQWDGLIAVNYAARKFGISRHENIAEAKKLCPELIMQHVATWKEGEDIWAYHDDATRNIATEKVSLDPYRAQSKAILGLIKATLPKPPLQKVEKAGIDEVFVDLSAQVHATMLERYPELALPAPYDDSSELLPLPHSTVLDWQADNLVDLDDNEAEEHIPDWDDIAILIGSQIVREVRQTIFDRLKYTCSGGIARNKMMAKLGSAYKKPNQQTIIRNRAVQSFMSQFDFTKIRNLGGKFGQDVEKRFHTSTVDGLLAFSLEDMRKQVGDESGTWLYNTIRGVDKSEVNIRTQIKSMLSAKSFRPNLTTYGQAMKWIVTLVSDIYARLVDEGVLEMLRRPRTIHLHHRQSGVTRSKSSPIPQVRVITKDILQGLAEKLLSQIIVEGNAWPCVNLMLSVGGFEEGIGSNQNIGAFLMSKEETKALNALKRDVDSVGSDSDHAKEKKRKAEPSSIGKYFTTQSSQTNYSHGKDSVNANSRSIPESEALLKSRLGSPSRSSDGKPPAKEVPSGEFNCEICSKNIRLAEQNEHIDWHFAKDIADQERQELRQVQTASEPNKPDRQREIRNNKPVSREKGQAKLTFRR
jgi:DNA polymerase eta